MIFQAGQVFHLWCHFCNPQKNKYFVLAVVEPVPRFFLINSAVNAFQAKRPHLLASILPLKSSACRFLHHNSFLDCTALIGGYTAQQLEDKVTADPRVFVGRLDVNTRRAARAIIAQTKLLPITDKTSLLALW